MVSPVLESYGVNTGNKHVMKALTGYDIIKSNVMEKPDRVMDDIKQVEHTLGQENANLILHDKTSII